MKKLILFIIMSVFIFVLLKAETFTLGEVLNPDSIFVSSEKVYITEGATIYIYSKNNLNYVGKFGKKGEGPGEINASRRGGLSFNLNIVNNNIFIHNRSKVMFFEENGRFIREKKLNGGFIRGMIPVGSNFIARSFKIGENRTRTESITIYNSDFKKVRDIPGKKGAEFTRGSFVKIYFDQNIFNMKSHGKIIYFNNSKEFVINKARFNSVGMHLRTFR